MSYQKSHQNKVYVYPQLHGVDLVFLRIGGVGLGNLLFPFARAVIFAKRYGFRLIAPTWFQIKLGPLMRGEEDKRLYSDLFDSCDYINGIKKFLILFFKKLNGDIYVDNLPWDIISHSNYPLVFIFKGMGNLFDDIKDGHAIVYEEILKITKERHLSKIKNNKEFIIGIHIRMGDFVVNKNETAAFSYRADLGWYMGCIDRIRQVLQYPAKALIFSDGNEHELSRVLQMGSVEKVYYGSAISDILALSKCDVLIASRSTFSMWASYLGRMPTLYPPGFREIVHLDCFEGDVSGDEDLPERLKSDLMIRFKQKSE